MIHNLPPRVHTSLATSEAFVSIENAIPRLRYLLAASDPDPKDIIEIRYLLLRMNNSMGTLLNIYFEVEK